MCDIKKVLDLKRDQSKQLFWQKGLQSLYLESYIMLNFLLKIQFKNQLNSNLHVATHRGFFPGFLTLGFSFFLNFCVPKAPSSHSVGTCALLPEDLKFYFYSAIQKPCKIFTIFIYQCYITSVKLQTDETCVKGTCF